MQYKKFLIFKNKNMNGLKSKNSNSTLGWILSLLIILGLTLPFHWSLDYFTVFPKEHLSFSHTYFTIEDIQTIIGRYNNASFLEAKSISNEPFVRKLIENNLIVNKDFNEENKINNQSNGKSSSSYSKNNTAVKKQNMPANDIQDYTIDEVIEMSAKEFYSQYIANQATVDNKYKGKLLSLNGKVKEVSSDYLSEGYIVTLESRSYRGVDCHFTSTNNYGVSNLIKDDEVYIVGRFDGSELSYPELKDCKIEDKYEKNERRSNQIQSKYIDKAIVALSLTDVIIYHNIKNDSDSIETNTVNSFDFDYKVNNITQGYLNSPYGNGGWEVTDDNVIETYGTIDYANQVFEWKIKIVLYPDLRFKYIEANYSSSYTHIPIDKEDFVTDIDQSFESWEFVYK